MKIFDWYILKRYLLTFFLMLLLFIPIGITVNLAEKIDRILENNVPLDEVAAYYFDFTIYFANLLFPLFLFRCTTLGEIRGFSKAVPSLYGPRGTVKYRKKVYKKS